MCTIFFDTILTLQTPMRYYWPELKQYFNTYLATETVNGCTLSFSIAQPVVDDYSPLLPSGTVARINANLSVVGRAIFLFATSVIGLRTIAGSEANLGDDVHVLHFVGKISRGPLIHPATPGTLIVDVSVDCKDAWPDRPTVLRCYFNREEKRFRTLAHLHVGDNVDLAGKLFGWVDGKPGVDLKETRPNFKGELPDRSLVSLPRIFQGVRVTNDFAVFSACAVDPRTLSAGRADGGASATRPSGDYHRSQGKGPAAAHNENVDPSGSPAARDVNLPVAVA